MNVSENGIYSPFDYDDSHLRGISRPSNPSAAEHGGVKHFGYPITDDQHDRNTTFTECDDCHQPLWKRQLDGEVWCSECGQVYVEKGSRPTTSSWSEGRGKGGESGFPLNWTYERTQYDGTGTERMFGGYLNAYQGDSDYEFGDLNDSILSDSR